MEPTPVFSQPDTLKKLKNILQMLRTADRKKEANLKKPEIDLVDISDATYGMMAGEIYPITDDNIKAFLTLYEILQGVKEWVKNRPELVEDVNNIVKLLAQELYLRHHTKEIVGRALAETISEVTAT